MVKPDCIIENTKSLNYKTMKKRQQKQLTEAVRKIRKISYILNESENRKVTRFLKELFQEYLEGGDDFESNPGEPEVVVFEGDEYTDYPGFPAALQALTSGPISIKFDEEYPKVIFKRNNNDIVCTFIVPEEFDWYS
jgi:hypothetical protein